MTIKKKLILNVISVLVMICIVVMASVVGMGFVKDKVSVLTQRSTPFQLKAVGLQRGLQEHASNLLKVASAPSLSHFNASRAEAEKTLHEMKKIADDFAALKGEASGDRKTEELAAITKDIFKTTEERLKAEDGARAADNLMRARLQDISKKLKDMDASIKKVQKGSMEQVSLSHDTVEKITQRLKNVQLVSNAVKDLKQSVIEIAAADNRAAVTIAQSHFNSASRWITNSIMVRAEKDSGVVKELLEGVGDVSKHVTGPQGLIELKTSLIAKPDEEVRKRFTDEMAFVNQKLSQIAVILADVDEKAVETFSSESARFDASLKGSNVAGEILTLNSELLSTGSDIKIQIKELFSARAVQDIDKITSDIRGKFDSAGMLQKKITDSLSAAKRPDEVRLIKGVATSLSEIKSLLFSKDGVIGKLQHVLTVNQQAIALDNKLRELIVHQREEGNKGVNVAHSEQERTIGAVNRMVNFSILLIVGMGVGAVVFGIAFGLWIYRSIDRPLREIIGIADEISKGNLTCEAKEGADELGTLSKSMNHMVRSFGNVISKILISVNSSVQVLNSLRGEAEKTSEGARVQSDQSSQIATAAEEMSQTIGDIAKNASIASETSTEAMKTAEGGKGVADGAVATVTRVYTSTEELAAMVEKLNGRVSEIGNIVVVIKDIADQTNLLALNAAIEAARAGEQGRGFAVVADSVRQLAERTINATTEISGKISAVQAESAQTKRSMGEASGEVKKANEYIRQVGDSLNRIVESVQKARGQITKIAAAVEQQSKTAEEVAANSERTSAIAEQQKDSAATVMKEIGGLIVATEELRNTTIGFQTKGNQLLILELAKADHQLFVGKIAAHLRGTAELDYSRLADHHSCRFGKWYDTKGKEMCGNLQSFKAIDAPHERVHMLAKEIGEAYGSGNKEKASALFDEMEKASKHIISLLDEIKREHR